jgi:ADP-heptose:LPS heptosyltransferase
MKMNLSTNHRLGEPLPEKIVVVRSLPGLGDWLCFVPALRALRSALPKAEITLIGLRQAQIYSQRFGHYFDNWLEFPGYPGIPEVSFSSQSTVSFLSHVQSMKFDLALQMHGNGSVTNSFTILLGARLNGEFFPIDQYCPDPERFLPDVACESEVLRYLQLLEFLGIPSKDSALEFPLWQSDWQEIEAIASAHKLNCKDYICIHPGASLNSRQWTHWHFAKVADALAAQGWRIVLTGTATEKKLTQAVAQTMQFSAIDLAGQTSLGGMAALLKNAQLLVCNDTGVSHLADALKVNSIIVFFNSDPQRWAPLDRHRHRVVSSYDTGKQVNVFPQPAIVLSEAEDLLKKEPIYAL